MARHGKATESLGDTLVQAVIVPSPEAAANDDGTGTNGEVMPAWDPLDVWRRCVRDVRESRDGDPDPA
jgi:hypothetical protein